MIVAYILNNPFKKREVKSNLSFGLEQKNKMDYINDAFKTLNTAKLKSIYLQLFLSLHQLYFLF